MPLTFPHCFWLCHILGLLEKILILLCVFSPTFPAGSGIPLSTTAAAHAALQLNGAIPLGALNPAALTGKAAGCSFWVVWGLASEQIPASGRYHTANHLLQGRRG